MTKPSKSRPEQPKRPAGATASQARNKVDPKTMAGKGASAKPMSAEARRVQSKKIVNKRQTPWGIIALTLVIVALAVGVVVYAVNKTNNKVKAGDPNKIAGIAHYTNLGRTHVPGTVKYPQSPPVGGDHSPVWADCNGDIYPNQIANENAVHPLEHGAVWITYKPGLDSADLSTLTDLVSGQQYIFMTPYAGLKTNISLQAWGYQLFVDSAKDPRIKQFIADLRLSRTNTPEFGASCDAPAFKSKPSTPGNPTES